MRCSLVLVLALSASPLTAQAVWTGAVDSSWSQPGNWSPAAVPDSTTDVVIPSGPNATVQLDVDAFARDVTLGSGALLDLGTWTLFVDGSWDSSAFGATAVGAGELELSGSGTFVTGTNTVANVVVSGFSTLGPARIAGNLVVAGNADVCDGTLEVGGDLAVTGAVQWNCSGGFAEHVIDVEGNAVLGDTIDAAPPEGATIRVGGDLQAGFLSGFVDGWIELDGGTVSAVEAHELPNLRVANGTAQLAAPTIQGWTTLVDALEIGAGATLSLGSWDLQVGGDLEASASGASITGAGALELIGNGMLDTGTTPITNTRIVNGSYTLAPSTFSGDLRLDHSVVSVLEGNDVGRR